MYFVDRNHVECPGFCFFSFNFDYAKNIMPPDCRCVYIVTKMVSSGTIHAPLCRSGLQASTPSAFFTRLRGMAEPSEPLLHKEAVFTLMTLGAGEEDRIFAAH